MMGGGILELALDASHIPGGACLGKAEGEGLPGRTAAPRKEL